MLHEVHLLQDTVHNLVRHRNAYALPAPSREQHRRISIELLVQPVKGIYERLGTLKLDEQLQVLADGELFHQDVFLRANAWISGGAGANMRSTGVSAEHLMTRHQGATARTHHLPDAIEVIVERQAKHGHVARR